MAAGVQVPFLPRMRDVDLKVHETQDLKGEFKAIIREMGLKVTSQRIAILRCLSQGRKHVTAQELYEKVSRTPEGQGLGFATVYRFLRDLAESHFVTEVRMGGLPARYELAPQKHHDHLTCLQCGKICEFENRAIENLQIKVAEQFGFTLTHHVLELYGHCPDCQLKNISIPSGHEKRI